jgi:hypothetical protein
MSISYALFNIGITLAYFFVASAVMPNVAVSRRWVTIAAVGFFTTCGFTHLDMAVHAITGAPEWPEWHMWVNHLVQLFAAWAFVIGLYFEFVTDKRNGSG